MNIGLESSTKITEIHIKIQQRNGKKCVTIVEGLDKLDMPSNISQETFLTLLSKKFRKSFNCRSNINKEDNSLTLSGDQRENIKTLLLTMKLVDDEQIKVHGF